MSDRVGYNPGKPWQVTITRRGKVIVVDTYDKATEVLVSVMQLSNPDNVMVYYVPGSINLSGSAFIRVCDNLLFSHMFSTGLKRDALVNRGNRGRWFR